MGYLLMLSTVNNLIPGRSDLDFPKYGPSALFTFTLFIFFLEQIASIVVEQRLTKLNVCMAELSGSGVGGVALLPGWMTQ